MARDYRYGHKPSSTMPARRTQQSDDPVSVEQKPSEKPAKAYLPKSRSSLKSDKAKANESQKQLDFESEKQTSEIQSSRAKAVKTYRQHKPDVVPVSKSREEDFQKVKNKLYQESLPKHVRKALEAQESLAKDEAERAEAERLLQLQDRREKRLKRFSFLGWLSIAGLTLLGMAWLFYAPFFLAFAVEMGWVSEDSRNRMDPAAAMRSELASKVIESPKKQAPAAPVLETQDPNAVRYTFYKELPQDVVLTTVQPLAVKTRAPMYLELLYLPNEALVQAERRRLAQKGYVMQMSTVSGKSGNHYVLRMGPYDDQRTLNRLKVELQKLGIDAKEVTLASVLKASESVKTNDAKVSAPASNSRGAVAPR